MAPMEQVEADAVVDLIAAEMTEQSLWETHIPAWHPRNETTDTTTSTDTSTDDAGDTGDDNGDDDGTDGTPAEQAAQAAVNVAYAKLREAEKERDQFKAQATKLGRAGMEENDRLKAEADDARNEAAALQERLDTIEWTGNVTSVAETLNFKKPSLAVKFVETTTTDTKGIKKELEAALKDIPELAGSKEPPPPVNDTNQNTGSMNQRMNNALRAASGRGPR